jgi:hypothetical protein
MANVRALLPIAAAALVIAGCGGGGKQAATTTTVAPPLTHKQLISRGNQICIDTDRAVSKLGKPTRDTTYWDKLMPLSKDALAQMQALRPAAKDKGAFDKMMGLARQEVAEIGKIRDALAKRNVAQASTRLRIATALDTKVKFAAKDVGFGFCSQLLSNWPA